MAIRTIDVLSYGIEQGTTDSTGGTEPSTSRVRSTVYIPLPNGLDDRYTVSATASTGKTVQVNLVGYAMTSPPFACDLYWYSSPYTFDLSSYTNIAYIKIVLRYSDQSDLTPEEITNCILTYDDGIYFEIGENGYPEPIDAPEPAEYAMTAPYPDSVFHIDPAYNYGYPFTALMPDIPHSGGAFAGASDLAAVRIPISVKVIGSEAFKDTALQRVRIAADCTYSEQSFPADCVVTRYPDDRYGQLYDCDGKAVLDYDGARVYVLKEDNNNG